MLLPIMKAPASVNEFNSAWCFSGSSNIQWWSKSSGMSPKGFSKLWLGPATKASNDIEMALVTLFMRFSPLGDILNSPFAPALKNVYKWMHTPSSLYGPSQAKNQCIWFMVFLFHLIFEGRRFFQPVLLGMLSMLAHAFFFCNPFLQVILHIIEHIFENCCVTPTESVGMCDCTGGVTHALWHRRAQRIVAAHHPLWVMCYILVEL